MIRWLKILVKTDDNSLRRPVEVFLCFLLFFEVLTAIIVFYHSSMVSDAFFDFDKTIFIATIVSLVILLIGKDIIRTIINKGFSAKIGNDSINVG